jgi:20S proteasome subunit beta 3
MCVLILLFLILILLELALARIHGGTFLAAVGKDAMVLAVDSRFSSQQSGPFMLGEHLRRIVRVGERTLVACYGLESDMDDLVHSLREKFTLYSDSDIDPESVARIISNTLYSGGLICQPIVVGFTRDGNPYICSMDGIGAQTISTKFAVMGTASSALYAICEQLYREDLSESELDNLVEQCMRRALQRDVMSGCSVILYTIKSSGIVSFRNIFTADV